MISETLFQATVNGRLDLCKKLLTVKGLEYVRNNDRLHIFRSIAKRKNKTMLEALDGMLDKHLQSYYDIIQDVKDGKEVPQAMLDEKITDIINYFLIGETLIVEHNATIKKP